MDFWLVFVVPVVIVVAIMLLAFRSAERAGAELGRCEPCRIDEGVASGYPDNYMFGGGPWTWVTPVCCERDGKRRRRRGRRR